MNCMYRFAPLVCFAASLAVCVPASADFIPISGFERQVFPSYVIATASLRPGVAPVDKLRLGDPRGLLGVQVKAPAGKTPVKVTIECPGFFEPSVFSGTLDKAGAEYSITPKIKYHFDRLAKCDQATPISVTYRVKLGDAAEEEQTVTCTMRSINDCPFALKQGDEVIDISFTFAAYVNEQHPFVDKLLREALDIGMVDKFTGYQANNESEVLLQAYALWDLLVARDIRYSSITTTAVGSDSVASQHVRLIEDSINNSQANCVDGSVLWVSLMRKIGIDAFLVMESSHCYAGFYAGRGETKMYGIETTLLGEEVDEEELQVPRKFQKAIPEDIRDDYSFASFVAAMNVGTKRLTESANRKDDDHETPEIQIIDIARIRKDGILPIAFQNKEEFVWRDYTEFLSESEEESEEEDEDWSEEDEEESEEDDEDE